MTVSISVNWEQYQKIKDTGKVTIYKRIDDRGYEGLNLRQTNIEGDFFFEAPEKLVKINNPYGKKGDKVTVKTTVRATIMGIKPRFLEDGLYWRIELGRGW